MPGRTPGSRPGCARSRSDGTSPEEFQETVPLSFRFAVPAGTWGGILLFSGALTLEPARLPSLCRSLIDQGRAGRAPVSPLRAARHTFSRFSTI